MRMPVSVKPKRRKAVRPVKAWGIRVRKLGVAEEYYQILPFTFGCRHEAIHENSNQDGEVVRVEIREIA